MINYIDQHKDRFGVEPICAVLTQAGAQIAPSTYYAAKKRSPSQRALADAALDERIQATYQANYQVYGVMKMWKVLNRQEVRDEHGRTTGVHYPPVARCTVARRMRALGLTGAVAGDHKRPRTTLPAKDAHPADQLNRDFTSPAPDNRWVADITYVPTWAGFVYVAFVMDLFSRRIVGWRVSGSLHTDLALDALEQAIWQRQRDGRVLSGLVHHADRGVQYRAIRYTERLEELGIVASVGSKGDSYDNAAAEALNRVFKTELIRRRGPWRTLEHVELEVLRWVDWYNTARPHTWCDYLAPAAYEHAYDAAQNPSAATAAEEHTTLH
ncbi:MAG: IS3 family transposase [Tessaracoccus sp.]|uniref:IS3 family transposase n=1 Tax=Tessaracoccus sp. TaxID=1971211 RepID=UPI001ED28A9A|nr:IS3 family transposase [Tessaracoccus sp.]MBK7819937.1 IS3 family transposase [Tessaracoccus sp.]